MYHYATGDISNIEVAPNYATALHRWVWQKSMITFCSLLQVNGGHSSGKEF